MKKFFATMVLAIALIFASSTDNRAEAYDYYVGTWRSGYDGYLMTETVSVYDMGFYCTVKAVQGRSVMYIDYRFYRAGAQVRFSNSDGVDNAVSNGTSIERNILNFVSRNNRF